MNSNLVTKQYLDVSFQGGDRVTTKEFAAMFDMSVNEMCDITGFSRQGLNQIVKGKSIKNGTKKAAARNILREISAHMINMDVASAQKRHADRVNAIWDVFGIKLQT